MSVRKDLESFLTKREINETRAEFASETEHLKIAFETLNVALSDQIKKIMSEKGLGVNELQRALKISSKTMNQLLHGNGNPTFTTLSKLAAFSGKQPRLVFE